jgi:hypothetical protein
MEWGDYFWVNFDHFWIKQYIKRQLGQYWKLARAKNRTTIGKFSLPKSVKRSIALFSVQKISLTRCRGGKAWNIQIRVSNTRHDKCLYEASVPLEKMKVMMISIEKFGFDAVLAKVYLKSHICKWRTRVIFVNLCCH